MINRIFNWTAGSFFRTLGRFVFYGLITAIIVFLFSIFNAKASVLSTSVSNLTIAGQNLTTNQDIYIGPGNVNISFDILLDTVFSSDWAKVSMVVCSNGAMSGGIISSGYQNYIKNIKHVDSQYSCTMVNGATGKVRMLTFDLLFGDSGGFDGYFTVYSPSFNLQLIDFVVDSSNYVNLFDYSSDTLISQNSTIINQNTQIINEQQETNDKLDTTNQELGEMNDYIQDDTPASTDDVDIDSLGTVSGLLPAGPVDSLLNIPFTFLSVLTSSIGGVCVPITGSFVFDSTLSIPCFDSFYDEVPDYLMNFINLIPAGFILIMYFKHLYKKVERAVSLQTTTDDEWGVI